MSETPAVFISYATQDQAFVSVLKQSLVDAGIKVLNPMADLQPGQNWQNAISAAVERASSILLVISEATAQSRWFNYEVALAVAQQSDDGLKQIIPIVIHPKAEVPYIFSKYQAIFAYDQTRDEPWLGRLTRAIYNTDGLATNFKEDLNKEQKNLEIVDELLREEKLLYARHQSIRTARLRNLMLTGLMGSVVLLTGVSTAIFLDERFDGSGRILSFVVGIITAVLGQLFYDALRRSFRNSLDEEE